MCHVLVIEDEWLIAEHVASIATDAGATSIDMAATQEEAVSAARMHPPVVILSDVKLALGTGPLAVRAIRDMLGPLPAIFITATPGECDPRDQVDLILSKPLVPHQLYEAFRRVVPA